MGPLPFPALFVRILALAFALGGAPALLNAAWQQYESAHFLLVTDQGPTKALPLLAHCERLRSLFATQLHPPLEKPRLVLLSSQSEFADLRPTAFASAFYTHLPFRDYLIIGPGNQLERITTHEFIHLLQQTAYPNLPLWLNEGMAEVYSTLQFQGSQAIVGAPIPFARQLLQRQTMPLATLFAATKSSPEYTAAGHASLLYAQSWAVTSLLMLHPKLQPRWPQLLQKLQQGQSAESALAEVHGLTLQKLEALLRESPKLPTQTLRLPVTNSGGGLNLTPVATPVSEGQLLAIRADMALATENLTLALSLAEQAAQQLPGQYAPHLTQAYALWRQGRNQAAAAAFFRAAQLGAPQPEAVLNAVAVFYEPSRMPQVLPLLERLVARQPNQPRAVLMLLNEWMRLGRYDEAFARIVTLPPPSASSPDRRSYYAILIQSAWFTGHYAAADDAVANFAKLAAEQPDVQPEVEHWRTFVQQSREQLLPQGNVALSDRRHFPPRDFRPGKQDPTESAELAPNYWMTGIKQFEGALVEVQCEPRPWRLIVAAGSQRRTFAFDKPSEVLINHGDSGPQEFSCGPAARPLRLRVYYRVEPGQPADWSGAIRRLDLLSPSSAPNLP